MPGWSRRTGGAAGTSPSGSTFTPIGPAVEWSAHRRHQRELEDRAGTALRRSGRACADHRLARPGRTWDRAAPLSDADGWTSTSTECAPRGSVERSDRVARQRRRVRSDAARPRRPCVVGRVALIPSLWRQPTCFEHGWRSRSSFSPTASSWRAGCRIFPKSRNGWHSATWSSAWHSLPWRSARLWHCRSPVGLSGGWVAMGRPERQG